MINGFSLKLRVIICTLMLVLSICSLSAQRHDANWFFGYAGGPKYPDTMTAVVKIQFFNFGKKKITTNQNNLMWLDATNSSISNVNGELLLYTNGIYLNNKDNQIVENGDSLNYIDATGYKLPQGALFLNYPDNSDKYILLLSENSYVKNVGFITTALKYSIIDINSNLGKGKVIFKNSYLINDTLTFGKIAATKHANGRDWWVILPQRDKPHFYKFLLTPDGFEDKGIQVLPGKLIDGLGQACFSPNGKKYISLNDISYGDGQFLDIFDFDRSTGILSNRKTAHEYNDDAKCGGVVISPNSKFGYFIFVNRIYQVDLNDIDPFGNMQEVAINDGFIDDFPTGFFMGQLAPDGKIYICADNSVKYLHIIDYPDKKGKACNIHQHGFKLPVFNLFSIPNFPNYRLGPIDGSECDTLGINNIPVANFRTDQDTSNTLNFEFNDLSYYEPSDWSWDFGDGSFSSDTSPVHTFPKKGKYVVCLTVSNQYGANTACDTLFIGVDPTSTYSLKNVEVSVFPNPASDYVNFIMNDYYPVRSILKIYDQKGVKLIEQVFRQGWNGIDVSAFVGGVYNYEVVDEGRDISNGRFIIVK